MNKDLKDKIYTIDPLVLSGIKDAYNKYPDGTKGKERCKELLAGKVNYNQLKKVLSDMKNFLKNGDIDRYELSGGKPFESWGWTVLNNDRDVIKDNKKSRKNSDSVGGIQGRRNAYNQKHTKRTTPLAPKNSLKSNSETYTSSLKPSTLFEEIKRIKNLMI